MKEQQLGQMKGVLYWITGLSGAGKTTIGNLLFYELKKRQDNVVLLDGDMLKAIVSDNITYSDPDRRNRAMKYARLCKLLTDQGINVICCTIAMYDKVREWNRKHNRGYVEIFLDVPWEVLCKRNQKGMYSDYNNGQFENLAGSKDLPVEFPKKPDIRLLNDGSISVRECVKRILSYKVQFLTEYDRDTSYWNYYYASNPEIEQPSNFSLFVSKYLCKENNILELGCGNGRDSVYFATHLGMDVTAIDASDKAIKDLNEKFNDLENAHFICDDFVCASALYKKQYDYCYSRFTLHSINEEQELMVLKNIRNALKAGGLFFIEVRGIHDELYGKGRTVGRNAYIYNGHYRRFLVKEELEDHLLKEGFSIEYSEENRGFAPFEGVDPMIIRIIAKV